jgi:Fe-S oxidoreductase
MVNKKVYNPGCALTLYKPEIAKKVLNFLNESYESMEIHNVCCKHNPGLPEGTQIINTCAGCDRRFSSLYEGINTISLWEVLVQNDRFPFPDYRGMKMTIHDACPIRSKPQVHKAIRILLQRMNIEIVEAERHGIHSMCCGDDLYPSLPIKEVHEKMIKRAQSMPCNDVCVYCVSCIKSMYIGGKKPRYILDLLFGEETEPQVYNTVEWHKQLQEYIDRH